MGQFSWLDCVTGEQIVDSYPRESYLLVPEKFGGGHIAESCYDGYGIFGGLDVYDLVADWNRKWISDNKDNPKFPTDWLCEKENLKDYAWFKHYCDLSLSPNEVMAKCKEEKANGGKGGCWDYPTEWRDIGIILGCYDSDSKKLKYPIKVTYDSSAVYESSARSISDPNQGWYTSPEELEDTWLFEWKKETFKDWMENEVNKSNSKNKKKER